MSYQMELDRQQRNGREEGIKEGIAIGAEQGEQRKAASIITNMLRKGKSPEEIADMTGEELEKIREIQKQLLQGNHCFLLYKRKN